MPRRWEGSERTPEPHAVPPEGDHWRNLGSPGTTVGDCSLSKRTGGPAPPSQEKEHTDPRAGQPGGGLTLWLLHSV